MEMPDYLLTTIHRYGESNYEVDEKDLDCRLAFAIDLAPLLSCLSNK
jgi:hypothetical protein